MKDIPISAAKAIAKRYGYDQVLIYARKVGEDPAPHGEHITTYGVTRDHCRAASIISDYLQGVMGWKPQTQEEATDDDRT